MRITLRWALAALLTLGVFWYLSGFGERKTDFSAEVKPILNKRCMACHGGVKKNGGFSLLFRGDALAITESGKPALIPGDPEGSEMIRRLTAHDPEERMPYGEDPLPENEIRILKKWVKEGAEWGEHWAFTPVQPQAVPASWWERWFGHGKWVRNEIDWFVLEKIKEAELSPSPEADRGALLRRVSLDLTGLPPGPELAQAYFAEPDPNLAYERLVDSLLTSPAYGERWAATWLDLARYADTKGYERDDSRSIWRYRDWLIQAFNADMPYDQFLTEQLAGDLLPNPTDAQYLATAFHRNTMTNDEGGTDNEEFRTAAVLDRVNTTWEVLMGTTFSCVQCHSHPYDPILHEEYYQFAAFFNNTRDEDTWADYPLLHEFAPTDSLKLLELKAWLGQNAHSEDAGAALTFVRTRQPAINSLTSDRFVNAELSDTKWLSMRDRGQARFKAVSLTGKTRLIARIQNMAGPGLAEFRTGAPDGPVIARWVLKEKTKTWWEVVEIPLKTTEGVHDVYVTYTSPVLKFEQSGLQFDWLHFTGPFPGQDRPGHAEAAATFEALIRTEPARTTPIMMDNPPEMFRPTHVFERGNWLSPGPEVKPGTPHALLPWPEGAPKNRLGLARWMTDPQHPLVARTLVNRLWEQLFGRGLVETVEDLGTQGLPPTHRELLDYLSWRLVHTHDWSMKQVLREMVLSATYRQDARAGKDALEKDPFNVWLARGPRVRLSAEQIRDQALAVSGLLSHKLYGPSVFPAQPEGIWMSPWNGASWKKSEGSEQHRRSLYTYWKRSSPYPSAMTFDGVSREVCSARRIRTNTPLQALVTLNDEVFVEAARTLALHARRAAPDPEAQIRLAYHWATGRPLSAEKLAPLLRLYEQALAVYGPDPEATCEFTQNMEGLNSPEGAALTTVANGILNLDELLTKN